MSASVDHNGGMSASVDHNCGMSASDDEIREIHGADISSAFTLRLTCPRLSGRIH
jgi:hypothetical protein